MGISGIAPEVPIFYEFRCQGTGTSAISKLGYILEKHLQNKDSCTKMPQL